MGHVSLSRPANFAGTTAARSEQAAPIVRKKVESKDAERVAGAPHGGELLKKVESALLSVVGLGGLLPALRGLVQGDQTSAGRPAWTCCTEDGPDCHPEPPPPFPGEPPEFPPKLPELRRPDQFEPIHEISLAKE
jgi:hypothetical protein